MSVTMGFSYSNSEYVISDISVISEYVVFGTTVKLNQFDSVNLGEVYLGGQVLNRVPFCKYLGMFLS